MKLWTVQPLEWYERLQQDGIILGERQHVDPDFLKGYEWLCSQMEQRIGPRPQPDVFPIWAWHTWDNAKKRKPDLRSTSHFMKGVKGVRIEIEKDPKDLVLSDFHLWSSFPLSSHGFLPRSEKEADEYDDWFLHTDFNYQMELHELPQYLQEKITKSWELVFDIDFYDQYITHKQEEKTIQATFWSLNIDEVRKVDYFTSR